jgi:hypothetical protein
MNWFPILLATAIAAVVFSGVSNPSRAFALLPYLAMVALIWMVIEGWKELKSAADAIRTR